MKIKPPIYFTSALLGASTLFLGPGLMGKELGLAAGFALLMFGLYGLSVRSRDGSGTTQNGSDGA